MPTETVSASGDLTLPEFLKKYPWPEAWAAEGPTRNFLYHFDLEATPEQIWPYLADVSAFNKLIGSSEMKFTEREGKLWGISKTPAGFLAWEEIPWEWEYGKSIAHARLYSRGFFKVFRARYMMETLGPGRLRLYTYFGVVPKGWYGKLTAKIFFKGLEKKYREAFKTILAYVHKQQKLLFTSKPIEFPPAVQGRVEEIKKALLAEGLSPALVGKVVDHVRTASEEDLVRIRVKPLARQWNVAERELLEVFLQATRKGLFNLTWDVICPHCRGVRQEIQTLGQLPKRGNCAACKIDFDATALNALEVTFHVHPSIRTVQKRVYCAAEPATKPHIKMQKTVQPQESLPLSTLLSLGRYRLRVQGRELYNLLDIDGQTDLNRLEWPDTLSQKNFKSAHFPTVVLQNTSPEARTFVLEENQMDQDTLRPVDLFSFQDFRDLFSQEALSSDIKLEIGVQTILFTDLVGSTKFYEMEGDTVAFAEVRRHFLKAYDVVKKNGGAVIKTIGDAVMAAFPRPRDGIRAAVELQEYFNGKNPETRLRLRVTLHAGSCLAVNLDNSIDYFGNTVNLAAKIQAVAGAGEVGFTEIIHHDPDVRAYLGEKSLPVGKLDFETKWAKKVIPVYRVEVK